MTSSPTPASSPSSGRTTRSPCWSTWSRSVWVWVCGDRRPSVCCSAGFQPLRRLAQVHRGIKGVIRDKVTKKGIPDAIIKVEDNNHDIRSGERLNLPLFLKNSSLLFPQAVELLTAFPGKAIFQSISSCNCPAELRKWHSGICSSNFLPDLL